MEWVIVWGLLAWGVAALAAGRGRSFFGFLLLSLLLSPLIGLVVVLVLSDKAKEEANAKIRADDEASKELVRRREHERQLEALKAITSRNTNAQQTPAVSVADELEKLAALKDKGLLTQDEFNEQKRNLLARAGG